MAALEAIVHPEANRLTTEWLDAQKGEICIINAAVLHKSVVFDRLDSIIIVNAPLITRLLRAKKRDKLPWGALLRRFLMQKHFLTQYLAGNADIYKVENPGIGESRVLADLEDTIGMILSKPGLGREGGS
jgi:dephospho-CoA kinase